MADKSLIHPQGSSGESPAEVVIRLDEGYLGGWPVLLEALRQADVRTGLRLTFGSLIRQVEAQTRPKPEEPTGLGAVVEDTAGVMWTRRGQVHWVSPDAHHYNEARTWAEIDAVEVLSEGVDL